MSDRFFINSYIWLIFMIFFGGILWFVTLLIHSSSPPSSPKLIDRIRQTSRLKHFSLKTEKSYLYYIRGFIRFHGMRHPRDMGAGEIRDYLSYLAIERHVAASTQNIALSAILFLYQQVLEIEVPYIEGIVRPRRAKRLPVIFTKSRQTSYQSSQYYQTWKLSHLSPQLCHSLIGKWLRHSDGSRTTRA